MKIHIFALRWKDEIRRSSQLRTLLKLVVVSRTWKKFQARTGFEPMTSAIPVQRSTNWANKPTGSWSMNWVQINIRVNEDFRYMKIHIFALRWKDEIRRSSQLRTLLKLVVVSRTWKKFQARTGLLTTTSFSSVLSCEDLLISYFKELLNCTRFWYVVRGNVVRV